MLVKCLLLIVLCVNSKAIGDTDRIYVTLSTLKTVKMKSIFVGK